jgi:hypothetical protein
MHTPTLLERLKCEFKRENNRRKMNWGMFPSSQHFGGKGCARALGHGLGQITSGSILHTNIYKLNNKLDNA